jgi:hypothetical protein
MAEANEESGPNVPAVPAGPSPEAVQELAQAIARQLMTRSDGSLALRSEGAQNGALGAGMGGFEGFGLSITYQGSTYELKVMPPLADNDGWSFALTDVASGQPAVTLASFQIVSSKVWSVNANVPPVTDLFGAINVRRVAIAFGAGPLATYEPQSVTVGGAIDVSVSEFDDGNVTVQAVDDKNSPHVLGTITVALGRADKKSLPLRVNNQNLPVGRYSVQVVGLSKTVSVTVPAGTPAIPFVPLQITAQESS